jgi:hypothetical protein
MLTHHSILATAECYKDIKLLPLSCCLNVIARYGYPDHLQRFGLWGVTFW